MTVLAGHEFAIAAMNDAMRSGRIHHAWLLAGPRGMGKARFAEQAAAGLLDGAVIGPAKDNHATLDHMRAGTHPDFRRLERLVKDVRDDAGPTELRRNITIEQVRALGSFLAGKPSHSERRAIIVDAVDDLEFAAANALLKNLEEPPAGTVFLLVSHAPQRLLPTIRSRCRILRFAPLSDDVMAVLLAEAMPDVPTGERSALVALAGGVPGRVFGHDGARTDVIERLVMRLLAQGDRDAQDAAALARRLSPKAAHEAYLAFLDRVPRALSHVAGQVPPAVRADAIAAYIEARALAGRAVALNADKGMTVIRLAGLLARVGAATASA